MALAANDAPLGDGSVSWYHALCGAGVGRRA
jgi:hypothetical protein